MTHPDRKKAKRYDMPGRCREFTDKVYGGVHDDPKALWKEINDSKYKFYPDAPEYKAFIGEMHGHSTLSDGSADPEQYYPRLRELAKLDFGALTDHDHGGVGKAELWDGNPSKWDKMKELAKKYNDPGHFTTILGYERDSYPFYNNLVLYFSNHDADMVRGIRDGELTEAELRALLARDDVIAVPHDTYLLSSGADFMALPHELCTPFMEIISRGDAAEYMGNPAFDENSACEGGFLQDALRMGHRIGCIGGSDDHGGMNGLIRPEASYPRKFSGMTGIWAKENTLPALFSALKARRTYAYMGGGCRMEIDFRINGHWMGEEFTCSPDETLNIWFSVRCDVPVKHVTIVKNCRNYLWFRDTPEQIVFDYRHENPTDIYYLRVETEDGRFGWTSPIYINCK
ncbi:MAG: DUF3604 domain-containing protein [Clostridia bacterium]|nr:DUF3604 domain-containing protein [Clostridia bacterium]